MKPARSPIGSRRRVRAAGSTCLAASLVILASPGRGATPDESPSPMPKLVASPEPGWPQWRGPRRDGICDETGLLQAWPPDGPRVLWKISGLGRGYSAPILAGGRIFITGDQDDALHIFALGQNGEKVWQTRNGRAWTDAYPGARSSCAYLENRLYHMNAHGRVVCLDPATGREIWAVDIRQRYGGQNITWGLSECLLVDGTRVYVTTGGSRALMAALDTTTGQTVWTTEPLLLGASHPPRQERVEKPADEADPPSYAAPILFQTGQRRRLVNCSLRHVFCVDADTGQLLWTRPMPTRYSVIALTPVLTADGVFVTAPDSGGGRLFDVRNPGSDSGPKTLWTSKLDTGHGGVVCVNGLLIGSWYRSGKGWACLEERTGQVLHQYKELAMGSVLYADGRLYCLSQEGEMALVVPSVKEFRFTGRFRFISGRKSDVWTHPVICEGKLYLRYHDELFCYDVRARP